MDGTNDERDIIALLALRLGQRHVELLTLFFQHPLLQVCEIAALHGRAASSIERYLGLLRSQGCLSRPSELVARLAEAGALSKRVDPARRDREHWDRHLFAVKGTVANLVLPSPVPLAGPRRG